MSAYDGGAGVLFSNATAAAADFLAANGWLIVAFVVVVREVRNRLISP